MEAQVLVQKLQSLSLGANIELFGSVMVVSMRPGVDRGTLRDAIFSHEGAFTLTHIEPGMFCISIGETKCFVGVTRWYIDFHQVVSDGTIDTLPARIGIRITAPHTA